MFSQIHCNSLSSKDLLAKVATVFYAAGVASDDLWLAVGKEIQARRLRLNYSSTDAVKRSIREAPVTNTLTAVEEGRASIMSVERYCAALGITLADVLRSAVVAMHEHDRVVTDEEWRLIRDFRRLKENPARDPWVALGQALPTIQAQEGDVVG